MKIKCECPVEGHAQGCPNDLFSALDLAIPSGGIEAGAEQQPVAIVGEQHNSLWTGALVRSRFIWSPPSGDLTKMIFPLEDLPVGTKLYTAPVPPQREPLSDSDTVREHEPFPRDTLERIIDDYVADYELNDGEVFRAPSDEDRFMLKDAILGLLVDPEWEREWSEHIAMLAQREPLSDYDIDELWEAASSTTDNDFDIHEFARLIESAHGIGGGSDDR